MINILKTNNFFAIAFLICIAIAIKLPFYYLHTPASIIQPILYKQVPLFQFQSDWLGFLVAQISIVIQSAWLNYLFLQSDLYPKQNFIPAYIFVLLSSTIISYNYFNFYHILIYLFLLIYTILLSIYHQTHAKSEAFIIGFIFGLFTFLFPNIIVFLPFLMSLFYILKPFVFKELLILISGLLFLWFYIFSFNYLLDLDIQNPFDFYFYTYNFINQDNYFKYIAFFTSLLLLLMSFISLKGIAFATTVKRKKNVNLIVVLLIGFVSVSLLSSRFLPDAFALLFIPFTFFLSLLFLRIKRIKFAEILNLIFILTIFIIHIKKIIV